MKESTYEFLIVANNANVFINRHIGKFLKNEIQNRYGLEIPYLDEELKEVFDRKIEYPQFLSSGFDRFDFDEFQKEVSKLVGAENVQTLLSVETRTFIGVFLPIDIEPTKIELPDFPKNWKTLIRRFLRFVTFGKPAAKKIDCASLFRLKSEMDLFAQKAQMPSDDKSLEKLDFSSWKNFFKVKGKVTKWESAIFTYSQLMLAINLAVKHNFPLWFR